MHLKALKRSVVIWLCLLLALAARSQSLVDISGIIVDENATPLWGATVFIDSLAIGSTSNEGGEFSLKVNPGNHLLTISYLGYEKQLLLVRVDRPQRLTISLKPLSSTLQEVVVSALRAEDNVRATETGRISLTKKEIETLPHMLGEIDPLKTLQLMPGVHTAGEGNTGFYVRGGAVDQNLVLLDGAVVYNPSHLFGFFSVFNGNTLQGMELYKGGIPANYGGRLSSITHIDTRRGDMDALKGEAGIGLLSANLLVEGPLKKGKGSFLLAGRRTYLDLFINPIRELFSVKDKLNYYFYDLNLNADYRLGKNDHLRLRTFLGKDNFQLGVASSFTNNIQWQNQTASLTWMHTYNDHVFSELAIQSVRYQTNFEAGINTYRFNVNSSIRDHGGSYQVEWEKNKHALRTGIQYVFHRLVPNHIHGESEDVAFDFGNNTVLYADEASVFINDKISVTEKLEINAGLRYTAFSQLGDFTRFITDENLQVLDTIRYGKGKRIVSYHNPEPRLGMRYSLNASSSLKLSFDRGFQYMHMAPLSSASLPMDVWVTSSTVVRPQLANQYSIGYYRNVKESLFEGSVVLYYKDMFNQLEYRDGAIIGYSKGYNYDDSFVFGKGNSYGAEFFVKKNEGKVTGFLAYTLAKTTRTFEELNNGEAFAAKYDRVHDLSLFGNVQYNSRWSFSGVFVYGTGNALNLPIARYVIQGNIVHEYGKRNSFRMPPYHRLDLSATLASRKSAKLESAWTFSIYNVYSRRNPYYIYFETAGDLQEYKLKTSLKQVSLFPILPAVTYRIKF